MNSLSAPINKTNITTNEDLFCPSQKIHPKHYSFTSGNSNVSSNSQKSYQLIIRTTELIQNLVIFLPNDMKLLLIEDNIELNEELSTFLQEEGYLTEKVLTYAEASEKIHAYCYDLVIVDIGLPDGSGFDIIRNLKKKGANSGILIISAKNAIADKVQGLELGADDYITKPFHIAEFNARIKSILRRKNFEGNNQIKFNEITIDVNAASVTVNESVLTLTKKEYELLLYFFYNKNRIVTKESIAEHLWGDHADSSDNFDFIYNHIKNLRKKLLNAGGKDYLKSVYGMGYKFSEDDARGKHEV